MGGLVTPLCRELGIEYPIWSVGFGFGAVPTLAAAVSNAGGLGVLGTFDFAPEEIRRLVAGARELTSRPFGINFIIVTDGTPEDQLEVNAGVRAAIAEHVPVVVLFWGDPAPFMADAHAEGVKVFIQVGSVEEAVSSAAAGVDGVIVQGVEAGGHVRGTRSIWDLLPHTVEAISPLPVLASGGIGDGRAIAAALQLGAQGVSLGTRFVASDEAFVHPAHKQRIVESNAEDTVRSVLFDKWWPGAPSRTLRNKTFLEWEAAGRPSPGQRPGEEALIGTRVLPNGDVQPWPRYAVGLIPPSFQGELDRVAMHVGESCTVVNDIKPAAEIVRDLARDAEAALPYASG